MTTDDASVPSVAPTACTSVSNISSLSFTPGTNRSTTIQKLKLKAPEEGGTKKDYEEFIECISNHVTVTWSYGKDVAEILKTTAQPSFNPPDDLSENDKKSNFKMHKWMNQVNKFLAREEALQENSGAMFSLLIGNISQIVKAKLKSKQGFTNAEEKGDLLWLLSKLEDIILSFEDITPIVLSMDDQLERIMKLRQGTQENELYLKTMIKEIKIYEKHGGRFLWGKHQEDQLEKTMTKLKEDKIKLDNISYDDEELLELKKLEKKKIHDEIVAMALIKRSDKKRFGNLQIQLKNSFLLGKNEYPTTIPDVLKVLNNYKQEWKGHVNPNRTETSQGVNLLQSANNEMSVPYLRGTNNKFFSHITCRLCGYKGHFQSHCPVAINSEGHKINTETNGNKDQTTEQQGGGVRNVTVSVQMSQASSSLNPNWILLDSESTDHFFVNKRLLTDVRKARGGKVLRMESSGGIIDTNQKGYFGSFPVWYHPRALGNVLSLALIAKKCWVVLDTASDNAFYVYFSPTQVIKFTCVQCGLYVYDASHVGVSKLRSAFHLLNTVVDNKSKYRNRDIRKADDAVILNRRLNHMAKDKFIHY